MLDKKDLEKINTIVKNAFTDFYESIFVPYIERNENEHKQIVDKLNEHKQIINKLEDKVDGIGEYIKDHQTRIRRVEVKVDSLSKSF